MKSIMFLILLCLSNASLAAEIVDCFYNGDDFQVILFNGTERTFANDNFPYAITSCRKNLAALYDGDDFKVYDANKNSFEYTFAQDSFEFAQISSGRNVVGLYDGDDFKVYDGNTGRFEYTFAQDNNENATLKAGGNIVALYDGDDFKVYDVTKARFEYTFAEDNNPHAKLVAGNQIALLYDGDDVKYYCNGQFNYISADDNQRARVIRNQRGHRRRNRISLQVGNTVYSLVKQTCELFTSR